MRISLESTWEVDKHDADEELGSVFSGVLYLEGLCCAE